MITRLTSRSLHNLDWRNHHDWWGILMSRLLRSLSFVTMLAVALPSFAITPSNDLLIAGAARTSRWTADL